MSGVMGSLNNVDQLVSIYIVGNRPSLEIESSIDVAQQDDLELRAVKTRG